MRDDFSAITRDMLGRRAGFRCSNPDCSKPTTGPQENSQKAINIGVAAHICAAAPGGKRYNYLQTTTERSSIENGIWLCQNCAKLIDCDERRYSTDMLKKWKIAAENDALLQLERGHGAVSIKDNHRAAMHDQQLRAFYRPILSIYNSSMQTNTITVIYLQNRGYFAKNLSIVFPLVDRKIERMLTNKQELDTDEVLTITLLGNLLLPIIPIRMAISFIDITGRIYQQEYQKFGSRETLTHPALIDTLKNDPQEAS